MIRHEFDRLWEAQASHNPQTLTQEARDAICGVLFRQRELKPPKVGKCTFEHNEDRLPKALPSVEARTIYEQLAHVRLSTGPVTDRPLKLAERDLLAGILLFDDKLTFTKMRKTLKLGSHVRINFEEAGEKELRGSRANKILMKPDHFGSGWRGLSWEARDAFVNKLLEEVDEGQLVQRLMLEDGLDETAASACATVPIIDGYGRLGATANAAIFKALREVQDPS